jgi:hypothetical protein
MYISELDPADPRARTVTPGGDAMAKAQDAMDDLKRRMDELEAAQPRKPEYTIERGQ